MMTLGDGKAHIALDGVTINNRWMRQRCGWCGIILLDYDKEQLLLPFDPAFYPAETIVFEYAGVMQFVGNVERLPADSCATIETKRLEAEGARGAEG